MAKMIGDVAEGAVNAASAAVAGAQGAVAAVAGKAGESPMGLSKASRMQGRKNRMSTSWPSLNTTKPTPIWNREGSSSTSPG